MEKNNTTIPPRQQNRKKTVPNEEAKLGQALSNIRIDTQDIYKIMQEERQIGQNFLLKSIGIKK